MDRVDTVDRADIYRLALRCAEFNHRGCTLNCGNCQFSVFNYGFDDNQASLLKAQAYSDYYAREQLLAENKNKLKQINAGPTVVLILLIIAVITCVNKCGSVKPPTQTVDIKAIEEQIKNDPDFKYIAPRPNDVSIIPHCLNLMRRYPIIVKDYNNDNKIDCIDYSMTFRELYGSRARLIINYNPKQNFNHMFVRVEYDQMLYIDIEPQGTSTSYIMSQFWGMRYDPKYNEDVTERWGILTRDLMYPERYGL